MAPLSTNEPKAKLKSTTIRGGMASVIASIATLIVLVGARFGFDLGTEEITLVITSIVSLIGGIIAIIGRIRATTTVK